jgi:serine protease Do
MAKGKKYAAACLGSGMILAALALTQDYQDQLTLAAEQEQGSVGLAIAGSEGETEMLPESEETNGGSVGLALSGESGQQEETDELEAVPHFNLDFSTDGSGDTQEQAEVSYETIETTATGEEGITALDVSGIVENCMPSIVAITNRSVQEVESYFYGTQEVESLSAGSGIIIAQNDTELMIATNKHVVEDAKEITVCFTVDADDPEELIVPAVTKGTDSTYDLAVVAVKLSDIPADVLSQLKIATLGSSSKLKVGETAIAIGNALGIGQTVTCGIVSALEREVTTEAGTFTELQTDAAINFGCSGGALLNKRGEVIGINSAKATADYAESMGYAIPIDTAIPVLTELINRETREKVENHGYVGITVLPVSDEAKEMYNMPAGAFVYEVTEGSAGDLAGLKKGDIITKFDGITIESSDELVDTINYYEPGETVTLEVQEAQGGIYVAREVQVTLQGGTSTSDSSQDETAGNEEQQDGNDQYVTPDQDGDSYYGDYYSYGEDEEELFRDFYNYFFGDGNSSENGSGGRSGNGYY